MDRTMGDVDLARILVDGFLTDMPAQIEHLKDAMENGNGKLETGNLKLPKGVNYENLNCR
jgi:hypothetical protein